MPRATTKAHRDIFSCEKSRQTRRQQRGCRIGKFRLEQLLHFESVFAVGLETNTTQHACSN